jgi:hypothetical protein
MPTPPYFPVLNVNNDYPFRLMHEQRTWPLANPDPCLDDYIFRHVNLTNFNGIDGRPMFDDFVNRHLLNVLTQDPANYWTDPCHPGGRSQYWDSADPFGPWIDPDGLSWIFT